MPSLKDLKNRIKSVKNTQKITKAMKVVAAAKLKRAREQAENARPYAEAMERMVASLASSIPEGAHGPKLLFGTGKNHTHLLIIATSDRGLCGGFNGNLVRATRRHVHKLQADGKKVKLLFIGRKGYEQLQAEFRELTIGKLDVLKKKMTYGDVEIVVAEVLKRLEAGEFDVCAVVYSKFKSAISQEVTWQQLVPLSPAEWRGPVSSVPDPATSAGVYEYEPEEEEILADLLPKNLGVQLYKALLENSASEQGARMTAMDNATRNAGDMIKRLNLKYNRTRQAAITKELIEIISGAEAV
ncbi:MAG: F0F1 ATP synthase subunit gamma [Alphaproteobacteria bacterium]|nr:F0F1 ATP synthase subunit gamma [Alphaproteobacteria bacterium]